MSDHRKTALAIQALVEAALKSAHRLRKRRFREDPVNWADLGCTDVEFVQPVEGNAFFRAIIEEASPDCRELPEFIRERLEQGGFPGVEVSTEW